MKSINKVCVIGSGVMGSAIAAQVANAKIDVLLLDLVTQDSVDRSHIARGAKEKLLETRPAPLSHYSNASYITVGNLVDDLSQIKEADLVIEAIVEKLDAKHELYSSIEPYLKDTVILASNTSTLPLKNLSMPLSPKLRQSFFITHFFNPPRFMELMELVSTRDSDESAKQLLQQFVERKLGKTVISCNDTPGFIANRLGCFLLEYATRKAINAKLNPAIIDMILAKFFGFPSTGIFGLYDLIGHDVMSLISESLITSLDGNDRYHQIYKENKLIDSLLAKGSIGRKTGRGFYELRQVDKEHKKEFYYLNFTDNQYHKIDGTDGKDRAGIPDTIDKLFALEDEYSIFFKSILSEFFIYAANLIPEVTTEPEHVDAAMRLGYSLKYGPFELLSRMPGGVNWLGKKKNPKIEKYSAVNFHKNNSINTSQVIEESNSARIIQKQQYILFEICSKMGVLNRDVFQLMIKAIDYAEENRQDMYIYSSAAVFSAGADLRFLKEKMINKEFTEISSLIKLGQRAMYKLKCANIKVISLAHGAALGGGAEILLHSDHVVAHQNLQAGLVEISVGLTPGWGGIKEMFIRGSSSIEQLRSNLHNIIFYKKS